MFPESFWLAPGTVHFFTKKNLITTKGREFGIHVFVETGTFRGEMINAQREHFLKLIGIELSEELFQAARLRFVNDRQIQLHQGHSGIKLRAVAKGLDEPALFWLDAHYRVDSRLNVTLGWSRQDFVASRFRLPRTVKKFLSLRSMFFFNSKGSSNACSARSWVLAASSMSGLASSR